MSTPTDPCRAVSLVAVRPRIATVVDLDGPADPDALMRYRHAQWMANKERRWCSLPFGHDGGHDFTLTESPFGDSGRGDLREAADDLTRAIEAADHEVAP